MNTQEIKNSAERAAKLYGAENYEIIITSTENAGAEALKDEISSVSYSLSGSMKVRCVKNGKSGYASSELVTPEAAAELCEQACDSAGIIDEADEVPLFAGSDHYEDVHDDVPALMSTEDMKAHTLELQRKAYAASDKIVDGTQSFTNGMKLTQTMLNSAGLNLSYACGLNYHGVAAAVKNGEDAAEEYRLADVTKESADVSVEKAVTTALSKLGAESVDSGKYNLIMDSDTVRSLLSTYSSVFSARSAYMKTTLLAGKEGEVVGSEKLTLVDDPFYPEKFGHCPFDGEGVAVYRKNVIEKGVLNTLLYNRMYGKLLGTETTGNALDAKSIEPKGLYVAAGELSKEDLMKKLGNGLYITSLNGLHAGANIQSGDFSLQAEGFLVENGQKSRPVKNFTVADNFFQLLKKVDALSDKVEFSLTSDFGSPEILFTDISVSGK